jgi:DNA-binding XRE family transcriptional regulator
LLVPSTRILTVKASFSFQEALASLKTHFLAGILGGKNVGTPTLATLKQLRQEAGLSAFELAHLAGVSLSTVNRMERGRPPVTRLTAGRVLHALSERLGRPVPMSEVEGLQLKDEEDAA